MQNDTEARIAAIPFNYNPSQLITRGVAAKIFCVTPVTLARWGKEGLVPTVKLPNGRHLYSKDWCNGYMLASAMKKKSAGQ